METLTKWLEIIEIRSIGSDRETLESHLQNLIGDVAHEPNLQAIKVYKHVTLETDFSIHLIHNSHKAEKSGSAICVQLISALKEFGLVNHTIWVEKPR